MQIVIKLLFLMLVLTAAAAAQPPEPAGDRLFEQVYLARDDGFGKPGAEATEFAATDIPIHCVVVLNRSDPATVRMELIAVNVSGVKPGTKVVSTSYTTRDMQDRVFFNGKPQRFWVAGDYRADIYIDGTLAGKFPFVIRSAAVPKPAQNYQPRQAPARPRSTTAKRTSP